LRATFLQLLMKRVMVIIISLTWMKDSCRLMNSMKSLNQQLFEAILNNIVIWEEIFDRNSRIVNQIILWFIAIAICSDDRMSTAKHVYFQSLYYGKYDFNLPNTHNTRDTTYSHDEKRKKKKTLFLLSNYFVIFGSQKYQNPKSTHDFHLWFCVIIYLVRAVYIKVKDKASIFNLSDQHTEDKS
jgi:hypothetical protein